jgi:hypothetical protein
MFHFPGSEIAGWLFLLQILVSVYCNKKNCPNKHAPKNTIHFPLILTHLFSFTQSFSTFSSPAYEVSLFLYAPIHRLPGLVLRMPFTILKQHYDIVTAVPYHTSPRLSLLGETYDKIFFDRLADFVSCWSE